MQSLGYSGVNNDYLLEFANTVGPKQIRGAFIKHILFEVTDFIFSVGEVKLLTISYFLLTTLRKIFSSKMKYVFY